MKTQEIADFIQKEINKEQPDFNLKKWFPGLFTALGNIKELVRICDIWGLEIVVRRKKT
jgi:hypothetical protein